MCDVTLALAVGSAVIGGVGAIYQGQASAAASKYNAQVAEMNATLSDRRAKDALARGAAAEQQKRMEVAQLKGRQLAASAANGVDVTFGSPLDAMVDTATLGELDALTIRRNAAREAYDYQVQAVNGRADAALSTMNGQNALMGSYLTAGGTVLGGLSNGYGDYADRTIGAIH
jgi:hypothetical protein